MAHISLVTLGVDDLTSATAFYEALGWRLSTASVAGTVSFFHGTPVLALFGREDLAGDAHLEPPGRDAPATSALAINLTGAQAVDDMLAAAQQAGGRICRSARRTEWGGYSGYFLDLDGHLWEVAHNPHFGLNADGRVTLPDNLSP